MIKNRCEKANQLALLFITQLRPLPSCRTLLNQSISVALLDPIPLLDVAAQIVSFGCVDFSDSAPSAIPVNPDTPRYSVDSAASRNPIAPPLLSIPS